MMMPEPTLLIVGGERRGPGRRSTYGARADRTCRVRLTEEQKTDLKQVAAAENKNLSTVIRDAIESYVGDFREARVFKKPSRYTPE